MLHALSSHVCCVRPLASQNFHDLRDIRATGSIWRALHVAMEVTVMPTDDMS